MLVKYRIKNLDCASCASKIEAHLEKHPEVRQVSVNFAALTLSIDTDDIETIRREIKGIDPVVDIYLLNNNPSVKAEINETEPDARMEIFIISIAILLFIVQLVFEKHLHDILGGWAEYIVSFAAYLLAGWNVLRGALRTIKKGELFDENVLMTIATVGAFTIHAVSEAVGVMLFFKVGEFLQNLAVSRSRRSIRALLEIRPGNANVKTSSGIKSVLPESVKPGDTIIVKPGEKIPLDGIVTDGESRINTSALTGEPVPSSIKPGSTVLAGEINISGLITVEVTKEYSDSSISKILELVENATAKKATTEQFITKFARFYTPAVVF